MDAPDLENTSLGKAFILSCLLYLNRCQCANRCDPNRRA